MGLGVGDERAEGAGRPDPGEGHGLRVGDEYDDGRGEG